MTTGRLRDDRLAGAVQDVARGRRAAGAPRARRPRSARVDDRRLPDRPPSSSSALRQPHRASGRSSGRRPAAASRPSPARSAIVLVDLGVALDGAAPAGVGQLAGERLDLRRDRRAAATFSPSGDEADARRACPSSSRRGRRRACVRPVVARAARARPPASAGRSDQRAVTTARDGHRRCTGRPIPGAYAVAQRADHDVAVTALSGAVRASMASQSDRGRVIHMRPVGTGAGLG